MPPLTQDEYLAGAQAKTIPGRTNEQFIREMSRVLMPVIDLTHQASLCEWSEAEVTLSTTATPLFVLPANAVDQTTSYQFIGVREVVSPATTTWQVRVAYPGMSDPQQEDFQVQTAEMRNMLSAGDGPALRAERGGRPLIVYPEGVLSVTRNGQLPTGDLIRLQILRTVTGGCGRSSRLPGLITASEV